MWRSEMEQLSSTMEDGGLTSDPIQQTQSSEVVPISDLWEDEHGN